MASKKKNPKDSSPPAKAIPPKPRSRGPAKAEEGHFNDEILETERGLSSPNLADWVKSDDSGGPRKTTPKIDGETGTTPKSGETEAISDGVDARPTKDSAGGGESHTDNDDPEVAKLMNMVIVALALIMLLLTLKK